MKLATLLALVVLPNVAVVGGRRVRHLKTQSSSLSSSSEPMYDELYHYRPKSLVTDHAAIDWDLHRIQNLLDDETDESFQAARNLYKYGAHSQSVAILELEEPTSVDIPAGSQVIGKSYKGATEVTGTLWDDTPKDSTILLVQYDTFPDQDHYVGCRVGANPLPFTDGCFAEIGSLGIPAIQANVAYTTNVTDYNVNFRTLRGFSIDVDKKMMKCDSCPYKTAEKYVDYYGQPTYADILINAAFDKTLTHNLTRGKQDFSSLDMTGRGTVIEMAIAYMNVWLYVIRELEDAIDDCSKCMNSDQKCDDIEYGVHAWDEAVAFYTGSRHRIDGTGNMLFYWADALCQEFKTCGDYGHDKNGTSYINHAIFRHFFRGQQFLVEKKCDDAWVAKNDIERLMTVPLIQGTIRYAHMMAGMDTIEKHKAEASLYAMTVLPLVHACSPIDASIIYDNMYVRDSPVVDFEAVKKALERNYECMRVGCNQIGGIWDDKTGSYKPDAHPCHHAIVTELTEEQKKIGWLIGVPVAGILLICMLTCFISNSAERRRNRDQRSNKSFQASMDEAAAELSLEPVPAENHPIT